MDALVVAEDSYSFAVGVVMLDSFSVSSGVPVSFEEKLSEAGFIRLWQSNRRQRFICK